MVAIIAFIFFSILVGLLGKDRKIGFGWSLVLSLLLSPIIGLIITIFSKKNSEVEFIDIKKDNI